MDGAEVAAFRSSGDFNAIALANNLLATAIDNHVHHGNALDIDVRRISWRRVVDMNDRALRDVVTSLGGVANGLIASHLVQAHDKD